MLYAGIYGAGCKICDTVQMMFTDVLIPGFPEIMTDIFSLTGPDFYRLAGVACMFSYFLTSLPDVATCN